MARPARFAAIMLTGFFSLIVLGGVWTFVVLLLPASVGEQGPIGSQAVFLPGGPARSQKAPSDLTDPEKVSALRLPPLDPLPTPVPIGQGGRSGSSHPAGLELKCEGEINTACPEGTFEERRYCMQSALRQLSAPCQQRAREHLVRMKANLQQIRSACEMDVRRFCRDVPVGGGAVVQCLETFAQEVSDQCFQTLPKKGRLN